jgi:hypothetical protein
MDSDLGGSSYRYRSNSSGSVYGSESYSNPSVPSSASTTSSLHMASLSLRSSSRGSAGRATGYERSSSRSNRRTSRSARVMDDDEEEEDDYEDEDDGQAEDEEDDEIYVSASSRSRSSSNRRSNSSKSAILADILIEHAESEPLALDMEAINHASSTPPSASATKRTTLNQRLVYNPDDRYASPSQKKFYVRGQDGYSMSQMSSISDAHGANTQISPPNSDEAKSTVSKLLELGQLSDHDRR